MEPTTRNRRTHQGTTGARRSRRAVAALLVAVAMPLAACGDDVTAPEPGEADTGVPLNVGTELPEATGTDSVAP